MICSIFYMWISCQLLDKTNYCSFTVGAVFGVCIFAWSTALTSYWVRLHLLQSSSLRIYA